MQDKYNSRRIQNDWSDFYKDIIKKEILNSKEYRDISLKEFLEKYEVKWNDVMSGDIGFVESRSNTKEQPLALTLDEQLEREGIKKEYLDIKYEDEEWVVATECSDWNSYDIRVFNKKDYTKTYFDSAGWELPWEKDAMEDWINCIVDGLNGED